MSKVFLPIQIIVYKSQDKLPMLLKSLALADKADFDIKLFVVKHDDADLAEYDKILGKTLKKTEYELIENANVGFGSGHNFLFDKFKHQYGDQFIVLNPDTLIFFDLFINLRAQLENLADRNWAALEFSQMPHEHPKPYNPNDLTTAWAAASAVVYRTAVFQEIGGFDQNIFMYHEDVDISWRMRLAGYDLLHLPNCRVGHFVGASSETKSVHEPSKLMTINSQAGELYLIEKYKLHEPETVRWIMQNSPYKKEVLERFNAMIAHGLPAVANVDRRIVGKNYKEARW